MKSLAHPFALLIALAILAVVPTSAEDLALDEILERHYEAIGGLDAWSALQAVRMTGTIALTESLDAPFIISARRPRYYRFEFEYKEQSNITAYDGETAWVLLPSVMQVVPQRLDEGGARSLWEMADFDGLLINYEEEGGRLEPVGTEELDGNLAYKLELTLKTGVVREIHVDADSFVVLRVAGIYETAGGSGRISRSYSEYTEIDGVLVAHAIEEFVESANVTRKTKIDSVEFNVELDAALFALPVVAETALVEGADEGR